jgi:hypothetical protein
MQYLKYFAVNICKQNATEHGFNLWAINDRIFSSEVMNAACSEAAAEFQKILGQHGAVFNEPIGALAHLGLSRAYTLQSDSAKARAKYQHFLTLSKDPDPDIAILIAPKRSTRSCSSSDLLSSLLRAPGNGLRAHRHLQMGGQMAQLFQLGSFPIGNDLHLTSRSGRILVQE